MTERISELTKLVLSGKMYHVPQPVNYDRRDLFLPEITYICVILDL